MAKRRDWVIGILIFASVLFVVLIFIVGFWGISGDTTGLGISGNKIGLVELRGVIYDSRSMVRKLERMRDSDAIRAVVLRINSPGGGVAASQEIYEAVKSIRESGKPILVSMGSVAASGGYYVACGADSIVANPGTTTGSIGVILEVPNFKGLLDKIGVKFEVVKSGTFKDTGSPYRDMTSRERKYLQSYIDDAFGQFVGVVAENRRLTKKAVLSFADGRIFTGKQAIKLGLVDRLGDYGTAIRLAAKMAGIKGKPKTYRFPKKKFTIFNILLGDLSEIKTKIESVPAFKYQYKMGTF
ncbi:MAG TPA: signal peptide peptidase SppA, partial [Bacteroidetes bacterium]|nr:signal peptide peptidase SppA [Bacteroidota bacterium]